MKSWEEIADPLVFPIGGKEYVIPELGYRDMLTIQKIRAGQSSELDGKTPEESWRLVMGTAWDEMVADNVPAEAIARAGLATLAFFEAGRESAEAIWENGVDPKAILAALSTGRQPQSSTAAANATPSAAPTSGTSSRPAGSKKGSKKGAASRSSSSSRTGR